MPKIAKPKATVRMCPNHPEKRAAVCCGGASLCPCGKRQDMCRVCNGAGYCHHLNRNGQTTRKQTCRLCNPALYCECGKRKRECPIHGAKHRCPCGKILGSCPTCNPDKFCAAHGRILAQCPDPACGGGSGICPCGKQKAGCALHGGSQICLEHGEHGTTRYKYRCLECGGSQICEHNIRRSICRPCHGSQMCAKHNIRKIFCKECTSFTKRVGSTGWCSACGDVQVKNTVLCAACRDEKPESTQQKVWDMIKDLLPKPDILDNKMIGGMDGGHKRRPDTCWVLEDRVVHFENDENGGHPFRPVECELAKLDDTNFGMPESLLDYAGKKKRTLIVRFNPNEYDGRRVTRSARCMELVAILNHYMFKPLEELDMCPVRCNVIYMFYHSKARCHIDAALAATETINVIQLVE